MIRLSQLRVSTAALSFFTALTKMDEVPTHVWGSHFWSARSQVAKLTRDGNRGRSGANERGAAGGDSWNNAACIGA
jgi:hypothetical protein